MLFLILIPLCAYGAPSEHLNWGAQLHSGSASCPNGAPIINVVQKVVNDIDSGTCGNYWAYDDVVRQIKVVQTGPGVFCATVSYQGKFTTVAGPSPGAAPACTSTIADGVGGTFQGGYVATFAGALLSSPGARTKGNIGTFDYGCNASTGDCPGYVGWVSLYFLYSSFDQPWWGWVYHAGNNGSWVNAASGNSGDITGQ